MIASSDPTTSFYRLDPDLVLAATEEAGYQPTGEFTQLNSYENRVFDIRLEKGASENERIIAKFYRPGRWSQAALHEEHEFLFDLEKEGVPVVSPLILPNRSSLLQISDMSVAFFPKFVGRMPEEFLEKDLYQIGRRLAQIHNIGGRKDFQHRAILGEAPYSSWDNLSLLSHWVRPEMWNRYEKAVITIIETYEENLDPGGFLRIHGDCHKGNLLARLLPGNQKEFSFVDFDDCSMGPEVQDFWMLFSGSDISASDLNEEQEMIVSGYEELREFQHEQWNWIPLLRGLRIFSYSAWIARRWSDPSFPQLFPNFEGYTFWAEETEALEKIAWSL